MTIKFHLLVETEGAVAVGCSALLDDLVFNVFSNFFNSSPLSPEKAPNRALVG